MAISMSECSIVVTSTTEPKCTVKITLTSPAVREEDEETGEKPVVKGREEDHDFLTIALSLLVEVESVNLYF